VRPRKFNLNQIVYAALGKIAHALHDTSNNEYSSY
jgi:hypothetical protein